MIKQKILKRVHRWLSWAFWGVGHAWCHCIMFPFDNRFFSTYPVYNRLMILSSNVQVGDDGPWDINPVSLTNFASHLRESAAHLGAPPVYYHPHIPLQVYKSLDQEDGPVVWNPDEPKITFKTRYDKENEK